MSTSEHPDALTRRLELLAGASGEEAAGESSVVAELVRGLRAEIGAVRAELGAAREQAAQDRAAMTELAASVHVALDGLQGVVEAEVEGVRAAVADTGTEVAEVLRSVLEVTGHVGALHDVVTRGVGVTQEALTGVTALSGSAEALAQTVEGFRTEWPTRTYEVVQGARAVADGVVREVRAEFGDQLERVQHELARATGGVELARDGLDAGTDRLSRAGAVLVAYLEQRDRLLEVERDTVLHDVLDTFATGLSARDRAALAGRVSDALARRRDGRDAERYRAAVGTPTSPTADLPEDVRRLAQAAPVPERTPEPPAQRELDAPDELEPPTAQDKNPPLSARVGAGTRRVVLPTGASTRGASGTSVTVRPTTGPPPAATVERPAGSRGEPVRPSPGADRRARVDVMPQVRSPEVAIEAAAPTPPAPTAGGTWTSGRPSPVAGPRTAPVPPARTPSPRQRPYQRHEPPDTTGGA